jgi:hypothetical protein
MDGNANAGTMYQARGGSWLVDGTLDTVLEINHQCLDYLVTMGSTESTSPLAPGRPDEIRDALSPEARAQLAASPYLLVGLHFEEEEHRRPPTAPSDLQRTDAPARPLFTGPGASDLIRRVLVFAWHMARAHPRHARVVLGMSPECVAYMGRLQLSELDWLAQNRPDCVRVRWERQPRLWQHLLRRSLLPGCESLTHPGLRGLQLMAGHALAMQRQ